MLKTVITALALLGAAQAHMHLHFPPTLLGDNNPHTPEGGADSKLNYPYGCCGQTVKEICKGHLPLLDQPEGKPAATWAAGQAANFSLSGHQIDSPTWNPVGGTHSGGSAQIAFSIDKGKTFKVVKTWNGNFPNHDNLSLDPADQTFDFTVPADLPSGNAVFAWSWINREQEFNMNCASVTITGKYDNTEEPEEQPKTTPQYKLAGCTCKCPTKGWTDSCKCYDCDSPTTKRRDVARQAVHKHRLHQERAARLNTPHRRKEAVAFASRPNMAFNIDLPDAACKSPSSPFELRFPDPGTDVVEKPGNDGYELAEPVC